MTMPMTIYYDSKTGNVKRFVDKINRLKNWNIVHISDTVGVYERGHLITFTTQIGKVPHTTLRFMAQYAHCICSVSSSGNMNWGVNFARAADILSQEYNIPVLIKFELSGLDRDVTNFIEKVTEYANKEMDTPQQ